MKPGHHPTAHLNSLSLQSPSFTTLDMKKMDFKVYSEVIDERDSNLLFSSVISNYGMLELDESVDGLPDKYEIREKKPTNSIRTVEG